MESVLRVARVHTPRTHAVPTNPLLTRHERAPVASACAAYVLGALTPPGAAAAATDDAAAGGHRLVPWLTRTMDRWWTILCVDSDAVLLARRTLALVPPPPHAADDDDGVRAHVLACLTLAHKQTADAADAAVGIMVAGGADAHLCAAVVRSEAHIACSLVCLPAGLFALGAAMHNTEERECLARAVVCEQLAIARQLARTHGPGALHACGSVPPSLFMCALASVLRDAPTSILDEVVGGGGGSGGGAPTPQA